VKFEALIPGTTRFPLRDGVWLIENGKITRPVSNLRFNESPAVLLANAFFLVIGFYFGRTNHARIGDWGRPLDDRSEGSRR